MEPLESAPVHGTVSLTRDLAAPPERVWAAFADLELRDRWFRIPGDRAAARHELDFRVGGGETATGVFAPSGTPETVEWRSRIFDLAAGRRLVFGYELTVDGLRRNVSLVTVVLAPEGGGTRLGYTEQYVLTALTGQEGQDEAHLRGSRCGSCSTGSKRPWTSGRPQCGCTGAFLGQRTGARMDSR